MNNERYTLRLLRTHDSILDLNSDEVVGRDSQPMHARLRVGGCSRSSPSADCLRCPSCPEFKNPKSESENFHISNGKTAGEFHDCALQRYRFDNLSQYFGIFLEKLFSWHLSLIIWDTHDQKVERHASRAVLSSVFYLYVLGLDRGVGRLQVTCHFSEELRRCCGED